MNWMTVAYALGGLTVLLIAGAFWFAFSQDCVEARGQEQRRGQ